MDSKVYLQVDLISGLCNKHYCLISALSMAKENGYTLVEPYYGWKKKICFSDIFDWSHFRDQMRENGISTINLDNFSQFKDVVNVKKVDGNILWQISEKRLKKIREDKSIEENDIILLFLKSLRPNEMNLSIISKFKKKLGKNYVAIHQRIEDDWCSAVVNWYSVPGECLIHSTKQIIKKYTEEFGSDPSSNIFISTGQKHQITIEEWENKGYKALTFFEDLEYEINAAMHFFLCIDSEIFIGNSRSTFTNLITMTRELLCKGENFIYNHETKGLLKRLDKGLQWDVNEVSLVNEVSCSTIG